MKSTIENAKTFLFLDTETTGFKKSGNLVQDGQARVCQIAMILTDINAKPLAKFSALIKPEGWEVSQYNIDTCKITQEECEQYGLNQVSVMACYNRLASMADVIVAHNADFDSGMMDIEQAYLQKYQNRLLMENRLTTLLLPIEKPWYCTMKNNTHISGGKWPKLEHALRHFCNREIGTKAHDAMVDTQACMEVFFASEMRQAA